MKFHIKNQPQLSLLKLLKRRKMSLKQWITEQGITTYDQLTSRCKNLGILAPTKIDFEHVHPQIVTDQMQGIVVLESSTNIDNELEIKPISKKKKIKINATNN